MTITEGEQDACSLYQVLHQPVVSVQSASSSIRDCTACRSWLSSFDRIYLCFDSDSVGREATAAVSKLFDYGKVFDVKLTSRKDANEYLQNGEGEVLRNTWFNSRKYLPETIVSSFDDFKTILKGKVRYGIPYPFPTLTEKTYGLRTGEIVLITAPEGVGKTELMYNLEHHLLKVTDDKIGCILHEESPRRHLQAIAGLELKRPAHLPDSGLEEDEIFSTVSKVIRMDERLYLHSSFGGDSAETLCDTIRFLVSACGCRFILFGNICMAIPLLAGENERQALDQISTRLEMMVKELDFGLIVVSHVNDFGQTRSSRAIGKVADIRIDLARDLQSGSRETLVTVSKNRYCGRTGMAGSLTFDPFTYTLSEMVSSNDNQAVTEGVAA